MSDYRIFLGQERTCVETAWFRSYNTFQANGLQPNQKAAFGALYALYDDTLDAGNVARFTVEEDTMLLLLPVVGAIGSNGSLGNETLLQAGELQLITLSAGHSITLHNPYEEGLVTFLHFWFRKNVTGQSGQLPVSFDLTAHKNSLLAPIVFQGDNFTLDMKIGKFDGRQSAAMQVGAETSHVFVFVLQGAFEVQDRLLEAKDGLGIENATEVEFEALANESILLIVSYSG